MPQAFEDSAVQYAYNSIHDFFDAFGLEHAIQYTNSILQAATINKVWKKDVPSGLLFYIENFTALCAAAFTIHCSYAKRKEAVITGPGNGVPDISVTQNFMSDRLYVNSAWNNFPRHLTAKQYHDPYKAIKKFCTCMAEPQWKEFLKDITEYALSKARLDETFPSYNILTIRLRMMQLIEACHLLEVRTNRKKTKATKSKKKKKRS